VSAAKRNGLALPVDIALANTLSVPWRTNSIDVVLCDPPFGKRLSSPAAVASLIPNGNNNYET